MDTDALLRERETTHGAYSENAAKIQEIKDTIRNSPNWESLLAIERESLDMIANKLGRILTGNPHFHDHWDDIAGYAKLVGNELRLTSKVAS